jgi:two-component system NtrC family sensor kinase
MDNGNGIPQKIVDKVFQPFFTTKPTGQGTGLGLSLSYDIIKAHGGEKKGNAKENEGSEFIIEFPVNKSRVNNLSGLIQCSILNFIYKFY